MAENFADRLVQAVKACRVPVCIGIDPVYEHMPAAITRRAGLDDDRSSESALDAILEFSRRVIRIVGGVVPAVKINIAFFEPFYGEGIDAYMELVQEAKELGLLVIGDCKRGDVGHTAERYAQAQLAGSQFENLQSLATPDAVTLHSYLGLDAVKPFLSVARAEGKGVFVLVRTSNESSTEVQGFRNADGKSLSEHVAGLVSEWSGDDGLVGQCGYSCVGAVVAARDAEEAARLRSLMPRSIFLVPGYGAQGAGADDIQHCFNADGLGAIVSASRSVIYAFDDERYKEQFGDNWEKCVEHACGDFASEVAKAVGLA